MSNILVDKLVELLQDKKAESINIIDFNHQHAFTDYFIVCEGTNKRQIDAIVDSLVQLSKGGEVEIRGIDGKGDSGWVIIDMFTVVVHVFDKNTREVYELDKLWHQYEQRLIG